MNSFGFIVGTYALLNEAFASAQYNSTHLKWKKRRKQKLLFIMAHAGKIDS